MARSFIVGNRLRCPGAYNGLSRMRGNSHVRFLGEELAARQTPYPTQNAGMRAPVGRRLRAGGVGCWVAGVFSLVRAAPTSKWSNALVVTSEADLLVRWVRGRQEKRSDFLINIAQCGVMRHQSLFDISHALSHYLILRQNFPQPDKSPNDVNTHGNRPRAIENIGGLESAMFREGPGQRAASTAAGF